jgi:hypothetical protein
LILLIGVVIVYQCRFFLIKNELVELKKSNHLKDEQLISLRVHYGESIARTNCFTCHEFNTATDNYLKGVIQRKGESYIRLFITKQDSLVNAKDHYSIQLKKDYGGLSNSHNFKFTDTELSALIEFMK